MTYRVTGEGKATITYNAGRVDAAGGKAQCAVAVRGQHRQRATAFGYYGRATCSAKVPAKGERR